MSLLSRCTQEMIEQRRIFKEASQLDIPTEISDRLNGLIKLDMKFKLLAKEKPWALQKISLQGVILVKECIQKVKNQCQTMFQSIWKKRIQEQKQQIRVSEKLIEDQHQTINKIDMEDDDDMIGQEISSENIESNAIFKPQEN